jgi:hypothetical protein
VFHELEVFLADPEFSKWPSALLGPFRSGRAMTSNR